MHDTRAAARFLSARLDDLPQKIKNPQGIPALEPIASELAMPKLLYLMLTLLMTMHASLAHAVAGETWEITSTSEMNGMKMPEITLTICQPKRREPDPRQMIQDDNCKISDIKTSGNKTTWKVRCDGDGQKMRGSGEITHNRNSYQGKMRMSGTADGEKMEMNTSYRGKRIGKACDTEKHVPTGGMMDGSNQLKDMFGF